MSGFDTVKGFGIIHKLLCVTSTVYIGGEIGEKTQLQNHLDLLKFHYNIFY